jgi:hypothetical protein
VSVVWSPAVAVAGLTVSVNRPVVLSTIKRRIAAAVALPCVAYLAEPHCEFSVVQGPTNMMAS